MKIIVNNGRTVHVVAKPAVAAKDNSPATRPVLKAHGPTHLIDVPEDEAKFLIARGFATKYEPPKAREAEPPKAREAEPPAPVTTETAKK